MGAGKTLAPADKNGLRKRGNIRFLFNKVIETKGHEWREKLIYKKV